MVPLALLCSDVMAYEPFVQLGLAVVLGGLIGLEREFHGRPAGLRTHILVCLGAALAMVGTVHLYRQAPEQAASPLRIDPGRIAAGVLTGIGFIGAGAVLRLRGTNRGLTTAACIWFVAAIGVVLGMGAYVAAVVGTIGALAVLMLLHPLEKLISPDAYRELIVVAELGDEMFSRVRGLIEGLGVKADGGEFKQDMVKDEIEITFNVKYRGKEMAEILARHLRELPGVRSIAWKLVGL